MCISRVGKLGEKITPVQLSAMKRPAASMWKLDGYCIQLLAAMIQKAETTVPTATMQVAKKCSPLPTRRQPNSITPRKLASRKKAVSTSNASSGPSTGAARAEKALQLAPNS